MDTNGYIRRATKADRDRILAIIPSGEYDGDYLHDYFDTLLDDPLYDAFVYVNKNQIVGLGAIFIIDGGTTGALRSARVRKEYQGKGVITQINYELFRQYPKVKYIVGASMSGLDETYRNIHLGRTRLLTTLKCVFYSGSKESISNLAEYYDAEITKILEKTDLEQMFREKKKYSSVFVGDRIIVDSIPYRIVESNVPIILTEKTKTIVSSQDNPDKTLLTFGSSFRLPTGELFCKVDIYGSIGTNLQTHILLHINMAMANSTNFKDVFTVELRLNPYNDKIEQMMSEIGLKNASVGTSRRTDVVCTEILNPLCSQM